MEPYHILYKRLVVYTDDLLTRPSSIKKDIENKVADIERFDAHLTKSLPRMKDYPLLAESVLSLVDHDDLIGYLGEFIIDEALNNCGQFEKKENSILLDLDKIGGTSSVNQNILDEIRSKVVSWHRIITLDNMEFIRRFLDSLYKRTNDIYESLSAEEKRLGKALASSEEERKRLLAQEEARRRGITEMELQKEEKRRQAQEEFSKRIKTRKKK